MVWHPDGEILVSCSYDDSMKLWRESDDEWVCEQTLSGKTLCNAAWRKSSEPLCGWIWLRKVLQ